MLKNREEAEDAVQEVYLKLWKLRDRLDDYKSLEGLAFRITSNLCLDLLRRRSTSREVIEQETYTSDGQDNQDPSGELEQKEFKEGVRKLIDQLPEPQRSLVYFRHIEGREYDEIAELMEMNTNAIRVALSRARKQMREMIKNSQTSWKT